MISDRHVLTAAHCRRSSVDAIVGEHSTTNSSDGTRHKACRYVNYPQFAPSDWNKDYAIVHLQQPVQLGPRAMPACLPTSALGGDFLAGKTMTVSGWGNTQLIGRPTVLHSVDVPGITNAECGDLYSSFTPILDEMLCAGDVTNGGIDACNGDSGGN